MPLDIQNVGRRKLRMLNNSQTITDLRIPPSNRLEKLGEILMDFIASGLIINGGLFFNGLRDNQNRLKLLIIIKRTDYGNFSKCASGRDSFRRVSKANEHNCI